MQNEQTEQKATDAVGGRVDTLVMWHDAEKRPLCKMSDNRMFIIDVDFPIEVAVRLGSGDVVTIERYIAYVSERGEMEDAAGNGLGFNWDDIWVWRELSELPAT